MARPRYKTNIDTPKSRKHKKPVRNRARNGVEKRMALEGVAHWLRRGFGLARFKKQHSA